MTTRAHTPHQGDYLFPPFVDIQGGTDTVTVLASNAFLSAKAPVDRAEFLAAVATELDVIVINRADLPELKGWEVELVAAGSNNPGAYMSALRYLVVAERLKEKEAVDEDQVNALVDLMDVSDDTGVPKVYADIARRLVRAGVTAPKEDR